MKKTTLTLLCSLLLLIVSCDKPDDIPTPGPNPGPDPVPVTPKGDTLGVGWTAQQLPITAMSDIFFQDSLVGYVGGEDLYKTNNGGATWLKVPDSSDVLNMFVTPDGGLHLFNHSGTVYKKFTNWAQNSTATMLGSNGRGQDLYFISNNIGFLTTDNSLLKTTNGGNTWERVVNTTGLQIAAYSAPFFLDSTTGWIFSNTKVFRTNGTITNWIASNMPAGQVIGITGMHVVSRTIIYAVTYTGQVLKSTDGGNNFTEATSLANTPGSSFCDIYFLDDLNGYANHNNRIYQTKDGGQTWTKVVAMLDTQIIELHFTDANHGWACTTGGKVLKYSR